MIIYNKLKKVRFIIGKCCHLYSLQKMDSAFEMYKPA